MNWLINLQKIPLSIRAKVLEIAPSILKPTFKILPFKLQKSALLPILHSVFEEVLLDGDFDFLQDKCLAIAINDLKVIWYISFDGTQLTMIDPQDILSKKQQENVRFSANGDDLLLIAGRKQDPDTLFFQRRLKIEGDTELGLEVKNLIDGIDLDLLPSTVHSLVDVFSTIINSTQQELRT